MLLDCDIGRIVGNISGTRMVEWGTYITRDTYSKIDAAVVQWFARVDASIIESAKVQDEAGEKNRIEAENRWCLWSQWDDWNIVGTHTSEKSLITLNSKGSWEWLS